PSVFDHLIDPFKRLVRLPLRNTPFQHSGRNTLHLRFTPINGVRGIRLHVDRGRFFPERASKHRESRVLRVDLLLCRHAGRVPDVSIWLRSVLTFDVLATVRHLVRLILSFPAHRPAPAREGKTFLFDDSGFSGLVEPRVAKCNLTAEYGLR